MSQPPRPVPPPLPPGAPGASLEYRRGAEGIDSAAWRFNKILFAYDKAILPARCIKCNSDNDVKMKRKQFTWAPPFVYLGLLGGLLPCLILILVLQKKSTITYGMCAEHRQKRMIRVFIILGWLTTVIGGFFLAAFLENVWIALFSVVSFIAMLVYIGITEAVLRPRKIDAQNIIELKGCGEAFLNTLPASQWDV